MSGRWVRAATLDAVRREEVMRAELDGATLALCAVGDEVFAIDDLCTHGAASLSDGYLDDGILECPLHRGAFDVRTGEAVVPPCVAAVRTYPVRIEDGAVMVLLAE